jgi:hypothetical protein
MKKLAFLMLLVLSGCTMVSNDRVFPKMAWYWTDEAKRQRESNRIHAAEMKAFKESQEQQNQPKEK